ncbi:MAG: nucleotide-diphospho-sugar transferase [Bacteroidales bacterium]|nr:nucleotide-diphospho-sugar transferase [Bacteroidales bacterium]
MFETPILFNVFVRLDSTKKVFERIREIKPRHFFIAADGPRQGHISDTENCEKVRKYILDNIDWDCKVETLFREKNLGCGLAPFEATTWFFKNVEEGIILEDDCVPSIGFFIYCKELLEKYRHNNNIFVIGGSNFQNKKRGNASYYFSAYGHIWGWATWRRAWEKCNYNLNPSDEQSFKAALNKYFSTNKEKDYWMGVFNTMKNHHLNDIWDYQWTVSQWLNSAINITPNLNLIQNVGFDENATHTKWETPGVSYLKAHEITAIKHPKKIKINRKADVYTFNKVFVPKIEKQNSISKFFKRIILSIVRSFGYDLVKINKKK